MPEFLTSLIPTTENCFFVRFTTGMAPFVREELARTGITSFLLEDQRTFLFTTDRPVTDLVKLNSVDDVFAFCGNFEGIKHTRDSLKIIREQAATLNLTNSAKHCYKIRNIKEHPSCKITATLLGKRNYNRFETEKMIAEGLAETTPWTYIKNEPGAPETDFDLRVLMEGATTLAGIRLAGKPLHRRGYKQHNTHGSLKPPVAWAMAKAANLDTTSKVLDPMCGAGTTLIEAGLQFYPAIIHGIDKSPEAISAAGNNADLAGVRINFTEGNILTQDLFPAASFDRIICNLPWGKQIKVTTDLEEMYKNVLLKFKYLLQPNGLIVLLTDQLVPLENAIQKTDIGEISHKYPLRLFGSGPVIFVIKC